MNEKQYQAIEFAQLAGVTVRTLHHMLPLIVSGSEPERGSVRVRRIQRPAWLRTRRYRVPVLTR